jgi:hypothetical protein
VTVEPCEPLVHASIDLLERPLHREQLALDLLERRQIRRRLGGERLVHGRQAR